MIFFVVIVNLFLTLLNIYVAIRIWQLRKIIAAIAIAVNNCESYLNCVLITAPQTLYQQKENLYHFRQQYQILQLRIQKTKQLIVLISWVYRLWLRKS